MITITIIKTFILPGIFLLLNWFSCLSTQTKVSICGCAREYIFCVYPHIESSFIVICLAYYLRELSSNYSIILWFRSKIENGWGQCFYNNTVTGASIVSFDCIATVCYDRLMHVRKHSCLLGVVVFCCCFFLFFFYTRMTRLLKCIFFLWD